MTLKKEDLTGFEAVTEAGDFGDLGLLNELEKPSVETDDENEE